MKKVALKRDLMLIMTLALPTIVEQALQTIVQYTDTAMVGRLGAGASAAVGLTTSVTWLVNSPLFAAGVGVLACISRAEGAGDRETVQKTGMQAVILALMTGLAEGVIFTAVSPFLPGWLGADADIQKEAGMYFTIVSLPMVFRASNIVLSSALRGVRDMKTPMKVNLLVNGLNIVLNFIFIYETRTVTLGSFSLPVFGAGLGVIGAAAATAVSHTLGGILMFAALFKNEKIQLKHKKIRLYPLIMRQCVSIGIPVALERVFTSLGHVTFTSFVTRLGTVAFASHTIALTAEQAFYIPGYGMQAAASTIVGNAIGEKDKHKLKRMSWLLILAAVAIMTVTGALLFLFPGPLMRLFSQDEAVIQGGMTVLRLVALSEPMFAVVIMLEGIFNGAGDTRMPFVYTMISMWGVRIVSTYICVYILHLNLTAVWCCMIADNVCRFCLLGRRFLHWKLYKEIENT